MIPLSCRVVLSQVREQAAQAAYQLTCHTADSLALSGRLPYMAETLSRALDLDPPSVAESCCRALANIMESLGQQQPFPAAILVQAAQKLLLLIDKSTAASQVGVQTVFRLANLALNRDCRRLIHSTIPFCHALKWILGTKTFKVRIYNRGPTEIVQQYRGRCSTLN